jgi:hypothetical protein
MGDILTSISILIVLTTFIIGYFERRSYSRRRRTLEFLRAVIEDDGPIHQANCRVATWLGEGRVIACDELEADDDQTIITLLDYYDLVSDTATQAVIDREMVIRHLGGRMAAAHELLSAYISCRRRRLGRPELYQTLECFVSRHLKPGVVSHQAPEWVSPVC